MPQRVTERRGWLTRCVAGSSPRRAVDRALCHFDCGGYARYADVGARPRRRLRPHNSTIMKDAAEEPKSGGSVGVGQVSDAPGMFPRGAGRRV